MPGSICLGTLLFWPLDTVCLKASSSIGRAAVSKTAGWGFDSLLACHTGSDSLAVWWQAIMTESGFNLEIETLVQEVIR